jgi:AraC-like DNA-binding protein
MSVLYLEEHLACGNYISDYNVGFKRFSLKKGDNIKLSDRSCHCLFFILNGEAELYYEANIYPLQKNTLCFVPISADYNLKMLTDTTVVANYFDRPIDFCEKLALESMPSFVDEKMHNPTMAINTALRNFLESLVFYLDNGVYCKHFHEIKMKELFYIMRYFYTKSEVANLFSPMLSANLDFKTMVLSHYLQANSVKELANICHYSLSSFNRIFKKNFNENPYIWLQNQRVKYIVGKLSDKNIPLGQIIDEFRFSSPSHFTIFCKKHLNVTPSQFRKEHLK